jgi:hypothetical protein
MKKSFLLFAFFSVRFTSLQCIAVPLSGHMAHTSLRMKNLLITGSILLCLSACTHYDYVLNPTPREPINPAEVKAFSESRLGFMSKKIANECDVSKEENEKYSDDMPAELIQTRIYHDKAAIDEMYYRHIDGCASIEFQLNDQGIPFNARILKEIPTGYNIGSSLLNTTLATKYEPRPSHGKWYFIKSALMTSVY